MNLVIDQGNSLCKIWLFDNNKILYQTKSDNQNFSKIILSLLNQYNISASVYATVINPNKKLIEILRQKTFFVFVSAQIPLPINIDYLTPQTLGADRIAAAVAANDIFPNQNVLIIDIGTAITFDLVTDTNTFIGGNISPGPVMRLKALNTFTAKLPMVELQQPTNKIGKSTKQAILNGVVWGISYEIQGYIDNYKKSFENLRTIITGGFSYFFEKKIKSSIFVKNNLIAKGLNKILEFNKHL